MVVVVMVMGDVGGDDAGGNRDDSLFPSSAGECS